MTALKKMFSVFPPKFLREQEGEAQAMMQLESCGMQRCVLSHVALPAKGPCENYCSGCQSKLWAILHWVCTRALTEGWTYGAPSSSHCSCQGVVKSVNKLLKINEIWHFPGDHSTLALLWRATRQFQGPTSEPLYCLNRTPQINGLTVEKDRVGQPRNPLRAWQLLFILVIALELLNIRIRQYFKESVNMNLWALLQVHFPWNVWF